MSSRGVKAGAAPRTGTHCPAAQPGPAANVRGPILVVDDEVDLLELVRYHLEAQGLRVVEATDGEEALARIAAENPALVILDLMLPGMDGLELCRTLRAREATASLPILMLTARATEVDRVVGLEIGADDYVVKPFSPGELVARVRALLRRAYQGALATVPHEVYEHGRLRVDFDSYEASLDGRPLRLPLREFELLKFFVTHPGRTYSRLDLLDLVWDPETHVDPRTVDVHIRRLRRRIERDDARPEIIVTVRGVGYRFDPKALES